MQARDVMISVLAQYGALSHQAGGLHTKREQQFVPPACVLSVLLLRSGGVLGRESACVSCDVCG